MGAWYVVAAYNTPSGVRFSHDGPFDRRTGPEDEHPEADRFSERLRNTIDHPDIQWHPSEQLSMAKKNLRHQIHCETGDIKDIPNRQYSAAIQQDIPMPGDE